MSGIFDVVPATAAASSAAASGAATAGAAAAASTFGSAAAAGLAGVAAEGAALAGASSGIGSYLTTAAFLASAGLSAASALRQGAVLEAQAKSERFNAQQELIRGKAESNLIRERLLRTLAAQTAAFGASGVELGSGSPVDVAEDTIRQAERELDVSRTNAEIAAGGRRARAGNLRGESATAIAGGLGRTGASLVDFVDRRFELA